MLSHSAASLTPTGGGWLATLGTIAAETRDVLATAPSLLAAPLAPPSKATTIQIGPVVRIDLF
jgi:hypothetical protein